MSWDNEQPWHEAFRGIPSAFNKDLADDLMEQTTDPAQMGVVILRLEALEAVAARINELSAIVAQNALVGEDATPEYDEEPE